ncbi:MAG: DUF6502 family protein [Xanthomonadales bacterium]|nr:DUF6502 family protein [Xanthomonadales bacterium]
MTLQVLPKDNLSPDTDWLIKSVYRMLRPVVRLLINRITYDALLDVVRRIYVDECSKILAQEMGSSNERQGKVTLSSLALRTGMDSRMINKLMATQPSYAPEELSREAAILARWASDPLYVDPENNLPKDLIIYGHGPTFQGLVTRAAGRNVTVNTVLDRLLEGGNVEMIDEFHVRLTNRFFSLGSKNEKPLIEVGSKAVGRLVNTIQHNVSHCALEPDEKWFQQARFSYSIPVEALPVYRQAVRDSLEKAMSEVEAVIDTFDSANSQGDLITAGVGAYYWEDSDHP